MSGRKRKLLVLDTRVAYDLRTVGLLDHEALGAAFILALWGAHRKTDGWDDASLARVVGLSGAKFKRRREQIMAYVSMIETGSEPTVRYGRDPLSRSRREAIIARDGARCRYCADEIGPFEIDHIMPLARGGSNRDENLGVACVPCNRAKSDLTLEEWGGPDVR